MPRALRLLVAAMVLAAAALTVTWAARNRNASEGPLQVTGTIEGTQVDVSARLTGRIVELSVREGQRVERGQPLVRLEAPELTAEARRAEAAVRTATAHLRDLQAGSR